MNMLNSNASACFRGGGASKQSIWQAMGTGTNTGVHAVSAVDNTNVYVGGTFTSAGGMSANYIARWDGANWRTMGTGVAGGSRVMVNAISAVDNSNVYVGGEFTSAGGVSANNIAKWNGSNWQAMGTGTNAQVLSIYAKDNSNVYVGGYFGIAGGNSIGSGIARWDGATWRAMGTGTSRHVLAIFALDNSNVYVGGNFTLAGGIGANYIAKWNGANWQAMGSGIFSGYVSAISAVDNSNVYVGGQFLYAGGITVRHVAKWNGANWQAMGFGVEAIGAEVSAISAVDNSNVYIGGYFERADKTSMNHVARWDGATWRAMDTVGFARFGVRMHAISALSNSNIYFGGFFTSAGGVSANNIVKWTNNY